MPQDAPVQAAVPGTIIVDELSVGFTPKGFGWRDGAPGYDGHHFWGRTARKSRLVGIWSTTLAPGAYRVLARIPGKHASTRKAVYKVKSVNGWKIRARNQAQEPGRLARAGTTHLRRAS